MSEPSLEAGVGLGFGATNARRAVCADGDIIGFNAIDTPTQAGPFFEWMARQVLDAADQGHPWLVAGFPGPVSDSETGTMVGPMVNVEGLSRSEYNLEAELTRADPAVGELIEEGFTVLAVNDGTLLAQASARFTNRAFDKVGALIFGTGVGAGVVEQDTVNNAVYRSDPRPNEIGHLIAGRKSKATFEDLYSGPALERRTGLKPEDILKNDRIWRDFGSAVGRLAQLLGLMSGVEVVVPCGGVGGHASEKYEPLLRKYLAARARFNNTAQHKYTPEIVTIPPSAADSFELRGAEGVMLDYVTRGRDGKN